MGLITNLYNSIIIKKPAKAVADKIVPPPSETTIKETSIEPVNKGGYRSIDYKDSKGQLVGGITVTGKKPWANSLGSGGGGSGGSPQGYSEVDVIATNFSKDTTENLLQQKGMTTERIGRIEPNKINPVGLGTSTGVYLENEKQKYLSDKEYNLRSNYIKDVQDKQMEFRRNPEAFSGVVGFSKKEITTDTGTTTNYDLNESYFKSLPTYKNYMDMFKSKDGGLYFNDETIKEANIMAKTSFRNLNTSTRIKYQLNEGLVGLSGLGESFKEFSINTIGMGGAVGSKKTPYQQLRENNILKSTDPRTMPTVPASYTFTKNPIKYSVEAITERPALTMPLAVQGGIIAGAGLGVASNIKSYGAITGIKQTIQGMSPVQFKNNVWTPNVKSEINKVVGKNKIPFKTVEVKGNDITYQFTKGKLGKYATNIDGKVYNINIKNIQYSKNINGLNYGQSGTAIKKPVVTYIGGELKTSVQSSSSTSYFVSIPNKTSTITKSINITPSSISITYTASTRNTLAKGKVGSTFFYEGVTSDVQAIRGVGLSIDKNIGSTSSTKNIYGGSKTPKPKFRGGGGSGIIQTTTQVQTQPVINLNIDKVLTPSKTTGYPVFVGQKTKTRNITGQILTPYNANTSRTKQRILPPRTPEFPTGTKDKEIFNYYGGSAQVQTSIPKTTPIQIVNPIQTGTRPNPNIITGGSFRGIPTSTGTPFISLPLFSYGGLDLPSNVVSKGRKKTQYTPSFSAIVYKVYGKKPRGQIETGLGFRPITKGFKFINKIRL